VAAITGVTLVKRFSYRGDALEEFSSKYHFAGPPPGDDASWSVLVTDLKNIEAAIYTSDVTYVQAYGYNSDVYSDPHVYVKDWTVPGPPPTGSATLTGGNPVAGDQAAVVEWKMNRLSKKGKPIFLRKYHHHGRVTASSPDQVEAGYKAVLDTYATAVAAFHGGMRTGPRYKLDPIPADAVVSHEVFPWITTRTLKRRGKRPRTGN